MIMTKLSLSPEMCLRPMPEITMREWEEPISASPSLPVDTAHTKLLIGLSSSVLLWTNKTKMGKPQKPI